MFRIFDKDGDGSIDFKVTAKILRFEHFFVQEFMIGTDMCGAGDPESKLRSAK